MNRLTIVGCAAALSLIATSCFGWDNYYLPAPVPGAQRAVVRYHRGPFGGVHYKNKYHMGHHGGVVEGGGGLFNGNFWTNVGNAVDVAGSVLDLINRDDVSEEERARSEEREAKFRSDMGQEDQQLQSAIANYNRLDALAVSFGLPSKPLAVAAPGPAPADPAGGGAAIGGQWANFPPGIVTPQQPAPQTPGQESGAQQPGPGGAWSNFPPGVATPQAPGQPQQGNNWSNFPQP